MYIHAPVVITMKSLCIIETFWSTCENFSENVLGWKLGISHFAVQTSEKLVLLIIFNIGQICVLFGPSLFTLHKYLYYNILNHTSQYAVELQNVIR